MQITNLKCPESKYSIKCPYEMEPEYITVHNTYNDASAMAEVSYMIGNNLKVSFHDAIDDIQVVHGIDHNRSTWNAGDGKYGDGNRKSIAIEICYSKSGGERFDQAEKNAAEYISMLLKEHGWGIDRVRTHQSWSGKYCPHRTLDYGWDRFLDMIKMYLEGETPVNNNVDVDGSDIEMKVYQNGSTSENVYADTNCTKKIGSLNPRERCECLGIYHDRALVQYEVGSTGNYKTGYCKWLGGVH